jgi:serine acetyltransferase
MVAAGAVVLNYSLPNCLLVGVPAKVVKTLPEYGSGK